MSESPAKVNRPFVQQAPDCFAGCSNLSRSDLCPFCRFCSDTGELPKDVQNGSLHSQKRFAIAMEFENDIVFTDPTTISSTPCGIQTRGPNLQHVINYSSSSNCSRRFSNDVSGFLVAKTHQRAIDSIITKNSSYPTVHAPSE